MSIFRAFLAAAKEAIAEVAATYRIHWEEDNRRLAAARKQAQDEQALIAARPNYYRPDLLDAYDKSNPTGEYHPYKKG